MILAGDIGGTKTLLSLFESSGQCVTKQQFASTEYKTFYELLRVFLQNSSVDNLHKICLGVAGPIVNGDCVATNLPWKLKRAKIAEISGVDKVHLLNDLEATAWGVLGLPEKDFVELNIDAVSKVGNIAVLAAGTGLGEAIVNWDGSKYHVMPTEGGHSDYAPSNEQEVELLRYLRDKYSGHVSYERVVSGMGLIDIYEFIKNTDLFPPNIETEQLMLEQDKASVISTMALKNADELCVKTMQVFCRNYGAEAGNLALKTLSTGGVVLAGGIGAKNIPILKYGDFMQGFLDKGRYRQVLQKISVKVCINLETALIGAVECARNRNA